MLAKQMGVILQGTSAAVVFEILAHSVEAFNELTHETLAQVREQWPIVGRSDLYYGGATYENTRGMGVQLVPLAQAGGSVKIQKVRKEAALRPKEKELLAVPSNKLYDRGVTVQTAEFLDGRIGGLYVSLNPATAKKFGVEAGQVVKISFDGAGGEAVVKIDETIATGVALIPRGMGIAIHEPAIAKLGGKVKS
jgi:NADH-quinone oxidoreductase subunit G